MNSTGGNGFSLTINFRDNPYYTEAIFIKPDDWLTSQNIVPANESFCMGDIVDGYISFEFNSATAPLCDLVINADGVSVLSYIYIYIYIVLTYLF